MSGRPIPVAVVGAGPYGLAIGAHLRAAGVGFRIFGTPMGSWRHHMPAGMFLKSEGFAATIAAPGDLHTLERYCRERSLDYAPVGVPVAIETFTGYGLWYQQELVPDVEDVEAVSLSRRDGGFALRLADGEQVRARRVVVASGIRAFEHVPDALRGLSSKLVTHTADHRSFDAFAGRDVTVVGAGQSALESAALLNEAGARTRVLAREARIAWNQVPPTGARSLRQRARRPASGLGNGWRLWGFENAGALFRRLPSRTRLRYVRETLGPAGAWWLRPRLDGVSIVLGASVEAATPRDGGVALTVRHQGGAVEEVTTEHVVAGTGFRPDVSRLPFLSPGLAGEIRQVDGFPVLDAHFGSSVAGLHMVGLAAAGSFGPACRFVLGARFAARRVTARLAAAT